VDVSIVRGSEIDQLRSLSILEAAASNTPADPQVNDKEEITP